VVEVSGIIAQPNSDANLRKIPLISQKNSHKKRAGINPRSFFIKEIFF
jgi:hypothetical protein